MLLITTGLLSGVICAPAHADLKLCNRMSYIVEAAIGIEEKGSAATRGWFRIDPGQCRVVLRGALMADQVYAHARVPAIYGPSPLPQTGHADLCVGQNNFVIGGARKCGRAGQHMARFTVVQPSQIEQDQAINFAEEAEYSETQARDAGIQRLLVVAGYDANPIDGIRGSKTDTALINFLQDNKLEPTAAARANFFDVLLDAAQKPGVGFAWCNDTHFTVLAAFGAEDKGAVTTRGWYRVEPGKCLRPDVVGQPKRLFSYGEAVDDDGRAVRRSGKPLAWGGGKTLCIREVKFELSEQSNCAARGLNAAGFVAVEPSERGGTTVRFK
ncbi:MAG: DUF1036 domain-containing protein [Rhizobiales bacterium]|nr:DUF1036 domain-containing protein [Hyphomicrobiales bacterium]